LHWAEDEGVAARSVFGPLLDMASWLAGLVDLARAYYRARFDPAAPPSAADDFIKQMRGSDSIIRGAAANDGV
jgi:hypothetical protein